MEKKRNKNDYKISILYIPLPSLHLSLIMQNDDGLEHKAKTEWILIEIENYFYAHTHTIYNSWSGT